MYCKKKIAYKKLLENSILIISFESDLQGFSERALHTCTLLISDSEIFNLILILMHLNAFSWFGIFSAS